MNDLRKLLMAEKLKGVELANQYAQETGLNPVELKTIDSYNTNSSLPVVNQKEMFDTGEPVVSEFIDPQAGQSLLRKPMYEEILKELRAKQLTQK